MDDRIGPAVPADTSLDVWRAQMRALAEMSPAQRLETWYDLNRQLGEMEERAVRRQHPTFDDVEVLVELVRRRYGRQLADAAWPSRTDAAS